MENEKEVESIDSLAQRDWVVYDKAKELRKEISVYKWQGYLTLILDAVSIVGITSGTYLASMPEGNKDSYGFVGAQVVFSLGSTLLYGFLKGRQHDSEHELHSIEQKSAYKRAEQVMNAKKGEMK